MGFEFMLDFDVENPGRVDAVLRSIPGFERYDPALAPRVALREL